MRMVIFIALVCSLLLIPEVRNTFTQTDVQDGENFIDELRERSLINQKVKEQEEFYTAQITPQQQEKVSGHYGSIGDNLRQKRDSTIREMRY